MTVIPDLFEEKKETKTRLNIAGEIKTGAQQLIDMGIVRPMKTFYGGTLEAASKTADLLDFYSDKIAGKLGIPETKDSIFEYLRDSWSDIGDSLIKEGLSDGLIQKIYKGLGEAGWEVPKLMTGGVVLKGATLPTFGALEAFKEAGDFRGAAMGAAQGALMHGIIKGVDTLPAGAKYPTAFVAGATVTPGGVEEKVTGGAIFTGLSIGRSTSVREFKELQRKYSPIVRGWEAISVGREKLYQDYINKLQPIENITQLAKIAGKKIKPGEDPGLLARTYAGVAQKARTMLEDKTFLMTPEGKIKITGEGLNPILNNYDKFSIEPNVKIRQKDLNNYLTARRTLKDLQRTVEVAGKRQRIATAQQTKNAKDTMNVLGKKYGVDIKLFEQTADRLYGYQKRILYKLVDSGVISQKLYDKILTQNSNYVPFDRIIDVDMGGVTPVSMKKFTGARSPIKRIKGSEKEIYDPVESMIRNTFKITEIADRNNVARNVAKLSEILPEEITPVKIRMQPIKVTEKEAGLAKTIFRPSQFKPKGDIIEYFEGGKRRYIEVSKNLYNAMTGLNETGSGLMVKILSVPAHTLRTGATITPEFMARNFIRDQFTGFIQTRFGFKPFVDSAEGIAAIMGKTEIYYDWMRSGGAYSGIVELSRTNLKKTLMELRGQKNLLKRLNIISHAQDISQLFEQATRIGAYKAAKRTGLSDIEAGFESRESTLDFARKGARTKDVNAVIAFFNAGIQAADKSVRVAKEDPLGFATKCVASITVPSVISYLANRNNPEYRELPRWQKDLFWMFQLGDTWVRIPKPFAYGQIFGSIPERFMEYFDSKDPEAFEGLGESVMESLSPVGTDIASAIIPTGLQPLIENATNWNFFLKRNIVPPYQARLLPAEQYKKYTSETAKGIGRVLNTSPAKIENITRGWFGGTGGYALEAGDVFLNAIKKLKGEELEPERPPEPADYPLIRGFTARPAYSGTSQSVQDFYNKTRKINQEYNTYVKLLKEGKKAEAEKLKEKYPEWRYAKVLNRYSDAMSRVSQQIDKIIQSDYTVEQKRELINKYEKLRVGMAQAANEFLKKQSTQKKKVIPNLFE